MLAFFALGLLIASPDGPRDSQPDCRRDFHHDDRTIEDDQGHVLLTVPAAPTFFDVRLPPGHYWLRWTQAPPNERVEIILLRHQSLAFPDYGVNLIAFSLAEDGDLDRGFRVLGIAFGVSSGADLNFPGLQVNAPGLGVEIGLSIALTERLEWIAPLPLFAYRFGDRGHHEWVPWAGVNQVLIGADDTDGAVFGFRLAAGADGRSWIGSHHAISYGVRVTSDGQTTSNHVIDNIAPNTFRSTVTAGYTLALIHGLTFNLGVALSENLSDDGQLTSWGVHRSDFDLRFGFGSMQYFAARPTPLIQFFVSPNFALEGYAAWEWRTSDGKYFDSYLVALAYLFE